MTENASSIAERIRGLVLQGRAAREEIQAAAEAHMRQVRSVNGDLARCAAWAERGLISEVVSLGDALDVAGRATILRLEGAAEAWASLLRAAGLGGMAEVDVALLETFVAAAGRYQSMAASMAAMRHAALRRAPLAERLFTLRALVDRDPRQPTWLEGVRRLEREAAAALAEAAREAVQAADPVLASQVIGWAEQLTVPMDEYREILAAAAALADKDRQAVLRARGTDLAARLHAAAVAMDWAGLEQAAREWTELVSAWDADPGLRAEVEAPLDMLRRERERRRDERARADAIARLELALDEGVPAEELERLVDAATRCDAMLPHAIARRLQDRRERAAAAAGRRRMLVGLLGLASAALLGTAGWLGWQWWEREARLATAVSMADASVRAADLSAAARVLESLREREPELATRSEWIAARERLMNAQEVADQAQAASEAVLNRAIELAEDGRDPVALEAKAMELRASVDRQPAIMREPFLKTADMLQAAAGALRQRAAIDARTAVKAFEARLSAVPDLAARESTRWDRTAWSERAQQLNLLANEARTAAATAASSPDGKTSAEALSSIASQAERDAKTASAFADRLDRVADMLARLERFNPDEKATLELWERLLSEGGDLLSGRGNLRSCELGRDAARVGVAIRDWRLSALPTLKAGSAGLSGSDWGDPALARQWEQVVTRHLEQHPLTPYRETAESLRGLARRTLEATTSAASLASAASDRLARSGFADLHEQCYEGGRILYRRGARGPSIESGNDLGKDASQLRSRKVSWKPATSERIWPSAMVVAQAQEAMRGADGRVARDAWLRMLVDFRAAGSGDPVMQWHAMRELWRGWRDFFADDSDPEDAAAIRWVRSLDTIPLLASEDPVLLAMSDPGARVEAARRAALTQLSNQFDATRLVAAVRRRDARIDAIGGALAPGGVARPGAAGSMTVIGLPDGTEVRVPGPGPSGWFAYPAWVQAGSLVWGERFPEPPITWPQTIFVTGDKP